MMDAAAFAEKVAHGQLSMLPRDWRPPAFLLRGMMLTTDNQECRGVTLDQILALRASQMAQDGQEAAEPQSENPLLLGKGSSDDTDVGIGPQAAQEAPEASGGHIPAPEPATPATEAPSPALTASDAERQAALAELEALAARNAEAAAEIERLTHGLEDAKRGIGSGGLAMTMSLRKLMARHNVQALRLPPLPLAEPVDAPSVRIRGIAATSDIDLDRTRFLRDCWPKLVRGRSSLWSVTISAAKSERSTRSMSI